MSRLPSPGNDAGVWGDILNDYLSQAHNADGTLKDTGLVSSKANDVDVVHLTGAETVTGVKTFTSQPIVPTPTAPTSAANKSYVDGLAGSGTLDSLTDVDTSGVASGEVLTYTGTEWAPTSVVLTAQDISVADSGSNYASANVEDVLAELSPDNFVKTSGGSQEKVGVYPSANGVVALDLDDGNVLHISSTSGNYSLTINGASVTQATSFTLIVDTSNTGNTPTWFSNITWVGGLQTISWTAGSRQMFSFLSIDGTNWYGWHLTTLSPVENETYTINGTLPTSSVGSFRLYNNSNETRTIVSVHVSVGTAPTGESAIFDVNKNGTTIFTNQANKPTISIASNVANASSIDVSAWNTGEYLTIDVDQDGTAADAVILICYRQG